MGKRLHWTPEYQAERQALTKEPAAALIADLPYIRKAIEQLNPAPDELRRLSGTLRRILVNRDITNVAAPRVGRLAFTAPDNKPFIKANEKVPFHFFASGGGSACGINSRAGIFQKGRMPPIDFHALADAVELSLDGFLNQPVLCLNGSWAQRGDVIEYVANVASGVHSGAPKKNDAHRLLSYIRNVASLSVSHDEEAAVLSVNEDAVSAPNGKFVHRPNEIDIVLFELLSAAHFLVTSPKVLELERVIADEFSE